MGISGWGRAADARYEGRTGAAAGFVALAIFAMIVFAAAVAAGVTILLRK